MLSSLLIATTSTSADDAAVIYDLSSQSDEDALLIACKNKQWDVVKTLLLDLIRSDIEDKV